MDTEFLREIGLTSYQTKVYLTLIEKGTLTATEVSKYSGVPQPKTYSSLDALIKMNLVELIPDYPKKYKAINPNITIPKLIEKKKKLIEEMEKDANEVINVLEKRYKEKKQRPGEYVWVIQRGKKEFLERLIEFINNSKKEILFFTLHYSVYPSLKKAITSAIKRGVKIKVIGYKTKETRDSYNTYKKMGCEVKSIKHDYPRFAVFDNKITAIRIGNFYVNIIVDDKPFSTIFKSFFNQEWKKAKENKTQK